MKYYIMEPTYKKSLVEYTAFTRQDENGKKIWLRKELGWRWGSFMFSIPETEEEAMEYIESKGYENVFDWASDYGWTILDQETEEEILDPDTSIVEMVQRQLLPSETDEFVDITEDYEDAEMIDCWDGCWEFWSADSYQTELSEEDVEAITEEAEEAYAENYEEGVEELGWQYVDTYFEMHCNPKLIECDAQGNPLEDADT